MSAYTVAVPLLLTFVLSLPILQPSVHAQTEASSPITVAQEDLDQDGNPDVTTIATRLLSDGDVVRVFDRDGDMRWSENWRDAADQDGDVWLFDVGGDGTAQLVIEFSTVDGLLRADVYADLNLDGNVDVEIAENQVTITEAGVVYPVVSVTAPGSWTMPDGRVNWNVSFTTDGGFLFDNPDLPAGIETLNFIRDFWLPYLIYDQQPDMEFTFHDDNEDGIPESMLWRLFSETPPQSGALRARVWANTGQSVPAQPDAESLWPFLAGVGQEVQGGPSYFDTPPFLGINWETARLTPPQFRGYPIETGFHVHNFSPFELGKTNYANFEIGQDYYDLADDNDGLPELHIRHRYFGPNDPMAWDLRTPISEIRYSWNLTNSNDLGWDYGLGLANREPVTQVVQFPDFSYNAVPYDQMPGWVNESKWDIMTLIAPEGSRYLSTEGIYEWGPVETAGQLLSAPEDRLLAQTVDFQNSLMSRYLAGEEVLVDIHRTFGDDLAVGLRGEVRASSAGEPGVYLSPVDHKLHLQYADFGVWNLDSGERLRVENLNGDSYLDRWTVEQDGAQVTQLTQVPGYLIFEDASGLYVRQASTPSASFEATPPANHDEWLTMREAMPNTGPSFEPTDLRAMFDQFAGAVWFIPEGSMVNLRLTGLGANMVVHLDESSERVRYAVLDGGAPRFEELQAPQLSATFSPSLPLEGLATETLPSLLGVHVVNDGSQDVHSVPVQLWATSPSGEAVQVGEQLVTLNTGEARQLWFSWAPPAPGDWSLAVTLVGPDSEQALTSVDLAVAPATKPAADEFLSLGGEQPFGGATIVLTAAAIALSVFVLALLIVRRQTRDES